MVESILDGLRKDPGELALDTMALLRGEDNDHAEAACIWWCETMMGWRKGQEK